MIFIFTTLKFVINAFIILCLFNLAIKNNLVNIKNVSENYLYSYLNKINSVLRISKNSYLVTTKIFFLFLVKNILLYSIIKKNIYVNIFTLIWVAHDILSFITNIIFIVLMIHIFNNNIFVFINKLKILDIISYYITSQNRIYEYVLKILLLFIFMKICMFFINFIPHIIY